MNIRLEVLLVVALFLVIVLIIFYDSPPKLRSVCVSTIGRLIDQQIGHEPVNIG